MTDNREQVLDTLRQFKLGSENQDIVDFGLVRALSVTDGRVSFVLEDTAKTGADLDALKTACTEILKKLDWVEDVEIVLITALPEDAVEAPLDGPRPIEGVRHVILVASGKGGVGKSTVSANLALCMAEQGLSVGLLDADVYGPSQHRIMGATGRPVSYGEELIPIAAQGIKLMSLGLLTEPDQALIWRGPILHDTLTRLLFGVRWAPLDVLLIDLPPGTGDVPLSIVQQVEVGGAVLVSTPQELSLIDLRRCVDLFNRTETPVLGLVENMSMHICPNCGTEDHIFGPGLETFAATSDIPFLGKLPLSHQICAIADTEAPMTAPRISDKASEPFRLIANNIVKAL